MQIESYNNGGSSNRQGPNSMHDLRSYSTSHASSVVPTTHMGMKEIVKMKKGKFNNSNKNGGGGGGSSSLKSWSFSDPELQRKKRVAGYKVYTVEGKMKGSLRKSFRWIKDIVYGWR